MKVQTIEALNKAIYRWDRIVTNNGFSPSDDPGCKLCRVFNCAYEPNEWGEVCPVADYTGDHQCRNTPYYDWERAKNPIEKLHHAKRMLRLLKEISARYRQCPHERTYENQPDYDRIEVICTDCNRIIKTLYREY